MEVMEVLVNKKKSKKIHSKGWCFFNILYSIDCWFAKGVQPEANTDWGGPGLGTHVLLNQDT